MEYLRRLATGTVTGFFQHDGFNSSATLAFYFLLSLLPFLIFLASALARLPIRDLPERMIRLSSDFVPATTMPTVERLLNATMHPNTGLLSAGFLFALISASNAFAEVTASLDRVYQIKPASFWKSRLDAIGTTFVVGGTMFVALSSLLLGPNFGRELERVFYIAHKFAVVWPALRWTLALLGALAAMEALYFMASRHERSLRQLLPGAVFAIVIWIISSALMGMYFRHFSYVNVVYGALSSLLLLAIWLQITAIAILLGAEVNVQVERLRESER